SAGPPAADSDMSFVLSDADRRLGLKTSVALQRLAEEVDAVRRSSFRRWRFVLACLWRHPPITLPHIGVNLALFLPVVTMALVLTAMLLLIGANVAAAVLIDWLSHNGVDKKIQNLCADLAVESAYPDLSAPSVSTIHCHWTLRDGHLINLPAMLLVRDDIIYVRPGSAFNVHCCELPQQQQSEQLARSFEPDDRYMPVLPDPARRSLSRPVSHRVLPPLRCRVKLTPAVDFVRDFLNLHIRGRSDLDALFARGCRACLVCVGVAFAVCLVAALAKRHVIGEDSVSAAYALAFPCLATLPILLLSCPPMWHALNLWELAKALVHVHRTSLASDELLRQPDRPPSMDSLTESIGSLSDLDTCDTTAAASIVAGWRDALAKLMYLLTDNAEVDWKLVHSFGTMSRLCCADKEGILSLPIPLPDKVCFLRRKHRHRSTPAQRKKSDMSLQTSEANSALLDTEAHIHVLDVSHDPKIAYRLDFDDPHWRRFLKSLKPLGLAILLNNCHPSARPSYDAFAHHVTAVTLPDDPRACVNKRRCLCDLARLIGFKDAARDPFSLQFTLGTYQQASKEDQGKDQFLRLLSALRQKAPVGHTFAALCSSGIWAGSTLCRARLMCSCQSCVRTTGMATLCLRSLNWTASACSLTSTAGTATQAIATHSHYTPVLNKMSPAGGSGDRCVELPPFRLSSEEAEDPPTPMLLNTPLSRTFSAETTLHRSSNLSLTDVDTCLSMQSGQVFLGMVASQFQANSDVVRLIDQLELGCIRFVYFSEENELRSRGFAERLGLESGWNCHISLRSDSCGGSRATVTADREPVPAGLTTTMSAATLAKLNNRSPSTGEPDELVFTAETPGGDRRQRPIPAAAQNRIPMMSTQRRPESAAACPAVTTPPPLAKRADASREESRAVVRRSEQVASATRHFAEIRPHLQKVDNVPLQVSLFTRLR
uniref:TIR domain-containing protein n=1 Tax=Macrostomum lignano TaxID=282301 RepID=A0A1I8J7S9_9PLAT